MNKKERDATIKRRPLSSVLLAAAAAALFTLSASLATCGMEVAPPESTCIYVRSVERITPRSVHEEMNAPIHRITWSDSTTSTTTGATRTLRVGDSAVVYRYKSTNK